jgi:hypothetical protein
LHSEIGSFSPVWPRLLVLLAHAAQKRHAMALLSTPLAGPGIHARQFVANDRQCRLCGNSRAADRGVEAAPTLINAVGGRMSLAGSNVTAPSWPSCASWWKLFAARRGRSRAPALQCRLAAICVICEHLWLNMLRLHTPHSGVPTARSPQRQIAVVRVVRVVHGKSLRRQIHGDPRSTPLAGRDSEQAPWPQ